MTGCFSRRAQADASSDVVVIRSMPTAVRPKALICQGCSGKFEPCISLAGPLHFHSRMTAVAVRRVDEDRSGLDMWAGGGCDIGISGGGPRAIRLWRMHSSVMAGALGSLTP